jgi:aspartyl-tRNA(Asn)/glutamyl-tRNA(Gln) amidotransferase subunit A
VPAYPLSPFGSVAHLGPHTLSVRDAALMMNVLKKPDARDWTALPPEATDYTVGLEDGIRGLRIAYSPTLGYAKNVHPEIAAAVDAAVRQLQALGAHVEQVDPGFEDPLDITTGLWFLGAHTVWSGLTPEQQAVTDPDFRAEAALGAQLSASQVQQLNLRRGVLGSTCASSCGATTCWSRPACRCRPLRRGLPARCRWTRRACWAGRRSATPST